MYAAKNSNILKKSLITSFIIIIPFVFFMGFSGLIAVSENPKVIPDLSFFYLLLKNQKEYLFIIVIILGISLTISTIDTLINAISSLIIVDGKALFNIKKQNNFFKISKYFIIILSIASFLIASKGFSVLYLFLLADLLCCAAVFPVFYGFYKKKFNEKKAVISILFGLLLGFLIFPSPDFTKSLLVGTLLPFDLFPQIISRSLLFVSFLLATVGPVVVIIAYDSFKRR